MRRRYAPDAGDLIWIDCHPAAGHEQPGRRPALVLSPKAYNERTSLALICPITSRINGYPFEVAVEGGAAIRGVVLADHIRSVGWRGRRAEFVAAAPAALVAEVRERLRPLLGF